MGGKGLSLPFLNQLDSQFLIHQYLVKVHISVTFSSASEPFLVIRKKIKITLLQNEEKKHTFFTFFFFFFYQY